nr:hypothetical protein [Tanacetum cinerariifolium]
MVNVIPPDYVDEVPVVEPNQHDDVLVVPEPVLVDDDEDPEEDEFKEEKDTQEEEDDDMEIDIEEDENEPELTYTYKEIDPFNPLPPASESEPDDEIEVENPIEHEDETVPASVNEMAHELVEKKGKAKDKFYGKLILELGNEVCSSVEQGTAVMEKLVEKLGNTKDEVECKKLKKELEEARFSNTLLCMQNERVERDLYWTRVQAHEFYQEMIHRGFVFKERSNEAINVLIEDEKSHVIMHPKSTHITQAAIHRIIKDSVDVTIAAERQGKQMSGMMLVDLDQLGVRIAVKLQRWFVKTESVFEISECVEGKKVKFGPALTWCKTKVATMGLETVNQMPWTEMKQLMTI